MSSKQKSSAGLRPTFFVIGVALLFAISTLAQVSFAYSGNYNTNVGLSPSECSVLSSPQTTIDFNSTMNSNGTNGNQWSAQNNYYLHSNVMSNGGSENFAQFDMAISGSGNVYGSIELWEGSFGSIYNVHTNTIRTVTNIKSGDNWYIDLTTNSNGQVTSATYYYYESGSGLYSKSITMGSSYVATTEPMSWTLDIVGENSGLYSTFSSGGGQIYYFPGGTATYLSGIPSCVQSPYVGTAEGSNIIYSAPSVSPSNQVNQAFRY